MRGGILALGIGILLTAGAAQAGPTPSNLDSDGDTFLNAFDNCTLLSNANQADSDHNGCGDACSQPITCDAAGNMNFVVGGADVTEIGMNFGMAVPPGTLGDCDGNMGSSAGRISWSSGWSS